MFGRKVSVSTMALQIAGHSLLDCYEGTIDTQIILQGLPCALYIFTITRKIYLQNIHFTIYMFDGTGTAYCRSKM